MGDSRTSLLGVAAPGTFDVVYLPEQASDPSTSANEGALFTKDNSGTTDLYFRSDSDGTVIQITGGQGFVKGVFPGSDNNVPRFDGNGTTLQASTVFITDTGGMTGGTTIELTTGLFVGDEVYPDQSDTKAYSQFGQTIAEPFDAADTYIDVINVYGLVNLTQNESITINGLDVAMVTDPTNTFDFDQMHGVFNNTNNQGSGDITDCVGGSYSSHNSGAGIVAGLVAGRFVYANTGAGSATRAFGIVIESPSNDGSNANITDAYGILIQEQNRGTNKWNLYSEGATPSYFEGFVGFGIDEPDAPVDARATSDTPGTGAIMIGAMNGSSGTVFRKASANGNFVIDNFNGSVWAAAFTMTHATGNAQFANRLLGKQGVDVASAGDLILGNDGNVFEVTGATTINAITTTGWENGSKITLLFTSNPTVKHNTAGGAGTAVMLFGSAADFSATAGSNKSFVLSEIGGTQAWREI